MLSVYLYIMGFVTQTQSAMKKCYTNDSLEQKFVLLTHISMNCAQFSFDNKRNM